MRNTYVKLFEFGSVVQVEMSFKRFLVVLYIGCSGPVVECLNKFNMLQSTNRQLGQSTRYTETMRTV